MKPEATLPLLLVVSTLPVWPDSDGFTLRVHGLLSSLARYWRISLIAEGPQDEIPEMTYLTNFTAVQAGRNYTFLPNSFDPTPFLNAVQTAIGVERPLAILLWGPIERELSALTDLPPLVVDRVDCLTLMAMRNILSSDRTLRRFLGAIRQAISLGQYESTLVKHATAVTVVGDDDARILRRVGRGLKVHVVPNGVRTMDILNVEGESVVPTVIFSGTLDFHPNVDAAIFLAVDIWPLIQATVPEARLRIVGRRPTSAIEALGSIPGVEIVADVADMHAELRQAWVAIAPMRRGSGLKNKVLEAWAAARPVVMTPIALNGLPNAVVADGCVHENPEGMARIVTQLLRDDELRRKTGQVVRKSVEDYATWIVMGERLNTVLRSVTGVAN